MDPNLQNTQVATPPEQFPPTQNPNQIEETKRVSKRLLFFVSLILAILIPVGIYAYSQHKKSLSHPVALTPTPIAKIKPSATPDPTANWQTYTGQYYTVKYPKNWVINDQNGISFYDPSSQQNQRTNGGTDENPATIQVPTKYFNVNVIASDETASDAATKTTSDPVYKGAGIKPSLVKVAGQQGYIYQQQGEGAQGYNLILSNGSLLATINIPVSDPNSDEITKEILSTFKFTNPSPSPTSSAATNSGQTTQ